MPGFHAGRPPRNKGRRYPADPPAVEEIIAVMQATGTRPESARLRALMIVLWRAGLRISEALALNETDLDPERGAILVRRGNTVEMSREGVSLVIIQRQLASAIRRAAAVTACRGSA